jgi:very-short-patch-repair endonuclease
MASAMAKVMRRARAQHGIVTYEQAVQYGLSTSALDRALRSGRVERVAPRVYRVAGAPETWEQRLAAAVLTTGGVVSHRAAARIWQLGDYDHIEVTVRGNGRRIKAGLIHRTQDLADGHLTNRAKLPVTTPMRTLVDLGAVVPEHLVADALERALIARICSVVAVERALDDVARRGRAGAGVIRNILNERALGQARPDGLLEARMARILREAGMPAPHFQFEVRINGRLIARVDFAYPDVRLAIEVDGFEVHGTPSAFQKDVERQNRLMAAGWTVLRFTWLDVVRRPDWVVAQIAAVLRDRRCA